MQSMSPAVLWEVFIGTVIFALLAFEAGLRFGRWRSRKPNPEALLPVRVLVTSTLGLLSFILGFTFGLATSHYDSRNQSVFDEAVAIGTAYHRADFLPDPERMTLRRLLREYIDLRLQVGPPGTNGEAIGRLRQLQEDIWAQAVGAGKKDSGTPPAPLMQSLTEVIDVHGERVIAGSRSRIPFRVWSVLYGILAISIAAAGYHAGLAGTVRSVASLAYAVVFAAVIVVIAAADVPGSEQLRTSHQALVDLRDRLPHFER